MPKTVQVYSAPIQKAYNDDYLTAMAQQLMQQGNQTSPVTTPLGGVARALTGALGGYQAKKQREKYDAQEDARKAAMSAMMAGLQSGQGLDEAMTFAPADLQEPLMMALIQNRMKEAGLDKQFEHDLQKLDIQGTQAKELKGMVSGDTVYGTDAANQRHAETMDNQRYLHSTPSGSAQLGADVTMRGQDISSKNAAASRDMQAQLAAIKLAQSDPAYKAQREAAAALPKHIDQAAETINLIDQLIGNESLGIPQHEGLSAAVGPIDKWLPSIRATTIDADSRIDQLGGKAFLSAFEALKGAGQITEKEGQEAKNAYARMNKAQYPEQFIEAAKEFRDVVEKGLKRAQASAGQPSTGLEQQETIRTYNPATGQFE